jgi:hypothetical protein
MRLAECKHFYNWIRKHGSIGTTLMGKLSQLYSKTPYWDEIEEMFEPEKEYIQALSYLDDLALKKLKRSM